MLHSCTPATNKKNILTSFQHEDRIIRVSIATIAFGIGVNCKAVHRMIHSRPLKNIEAFVQDTGRAGHDGHQHNSLRAQGETATLFWTQDLDLASKLFSENRSINPCKPIRIHFHPNKHILKDGRRVGQCTRFSKPKFRIIGVLTYI